MPRSTKRSIELLAGASLLLVALSGCFTPAPAPAPPVDDTPEPTAAVFVAPNTRTELLGAKLEGQFISDGNVLFSETGGGGIYYPIESTQDGGVPLSCWYGKDGVDLSSFEIAAQGLTQDAHEGTLAVLQGAGFTETTVGTTVTFTQVGDEGTTPAIVHVLRPDSWITGYRTFGGAASVTEINGWLATVAEQVYP